MTDKKNRQALHRGLKALISEEAIDMHEATKNVVATVSRETTGGYFMLPVAEIETNPFQPRTHFSEEDLEELKSSIVKHGVLEPVIVRRSKGRYELISGERRLRAVRSLGKTEIPAVIREKVSDREMQILALVENQIRADLNDYEVALAYQELIAQFSYTHDKVAEDTGKSRSFVSNTLRLLKLPEAIIQALQEKKISSGHARALLSAGEEEAQLQMLQKIVAEELSVRQVEKLVSETKEPKEKKNSSKEGRDPNIVELEGKLSTLMGTKVEISSKDNKGRLLIHFTDTSDLNRIIDFVKL